MKNHLFHSLIIVCILAFTASCISLRSHQQMETFADIINNSNHINEQIIPDSTSSNAESSNKPSPKVAAGVIIPIICVGLCVVFCFFCFKCVSNEQDQAQRGLQQRIPCYCGPIKLISRCCKYLLCIDVILRCLGYRRTNFEKDQQIRLKEEEVRWKKEEKERLKWQKKYGNSGSPAVNGQNPYQTQMRKEQLPQVSRWVQSTDPSEIQKITKQKCLICQKKNPDILSTCQNHCQLHLQCLVEYKNQNKMSKSSNLCPGCQQKYHNMVKYYCQKCHQRCTEMQIESGNVYVSQLDWKETVKSVGGEKCDECARKKRFWQ